MKSRSPRRRTLAPAFFPGFDFNLEHQIGKLPIHGVDDRHGSQKGLGMRGHAPIRRVKKRLEKLDIFRRTRSVPHSVETRPSLATGGSWTGGSLRVLPIGSQESRSEDGRLAQRHQNTKDQALQLYTLTTLLSRVECQSQSLQPVGSTLRRNHGPHPESIRSGMHQANLGTSWHEFDGLPNPLPFLIMIGNILAAPSIESSR